MKTLLSIGHGYSASALERLLVPLGWKIIATTRSEEKASEFRARGLEAVVWPDADLSSHIKAATHVLLSVAPNEAGDPVLAACRDAFEKTSFDWVGYLSTTGVYGDHQGGWVDERTPTSPSTKRGQLRVAAEAEWSQLELPLHIFRLAGIYGPERGPFAKVRHGTARRIIKPGQVFSRIHVDDIAHTLLASIKQPRASAIYNLCDDDPAPPEDVIAFAAELLGLPVSEAEDFETAEMTPMARSFYAESKKVRNNLIKEELGVELIYKDYRSALRQMLENEKTRTD